MSEPDEITGIKNSRKHISHIADLIGTTFRNRRLLLKKELLDELDQSKKEVVKWIYNAKPEDFGLKTPFYGTEEPASESQFEVIKRMLPDQNGDFVPDIQFVPKPVYEAFSSLKDEVERDINGQLDVGSAYRSPAFQVLVICYWFKRNDFDLRKTLAHVGLPGYSEHGSIKNCAIDFQIGKEIWLPSERAEKLASTKEFEWLRGNAERFGFELSYPKDNAYGVDFEPWHWRYVGD